MSVEESNNSLSDLYNRGLKFTDYLEGVNNSKQETQTQETKIKEEIDALRRQRNNAENANEVIKINEKIADLQKRLDNNNKNFNSNQKVDNLNKSLFDRYAYVDYARIPNATQNWKHFNPKDPIDPTKGFILNTTYIKTENLPVSGDNELEGADGLTIRHLIEWSERYPALQLRPQDFAYTKKLGYYPNNRMVVLRRFKNAVPDNLFDYHIQSGINKIQYLQPISTLISWVKPDEDFIDLTFNENWKSYEKGIIETIKSAFGSSIGESKTAASEGIGSDIFNNSLLSALLDAAGNSDGKFKREDGVNFFARNLDGNPNIIKKAHRRITGGDGLESNISFNLKFEYEMRYIDGVDPGYAMLDLIANCVRMGTSVSEFRFAVPALKNNTAIKNAINGNFEGDFSNFFNQVKEFISKSARIFTDIISQSIDTVTSTITGSNNNEAIKDVLGFIVSRYREDLKAALAVETGLPSGIWHVTLGNPKNPIISCGDLIITKSNLKLGKELGFNDFPNDFTVEYNLTSARERGRDEIMRIFNCGRGRLYVYPDFKLNPDYDAYNINSVDLNERTFKDPNNRFTDAPKQEGG